MKREILSDEGYRRYIRKNSTHLQLNLNLCSPRGLKLTETQLSHILDEVECQLPPHLKILPELTLTLQAATAEEDESAECIQTASLQIFTPHSSNAMAHFEATISTTAITLRCLSQRPINDIRRVSLFGNEPQQLSNKLVIVLVDDDPMLIRIVSQWIRELSEIYALETLSNGLDAVHYYTARKPCALLIMDNQMPQLCGIEASRRIRDYEKTHSIPAMPIIGISAADIDHSLLLEAGMNIFCQKPLKKTKLIEAMASLGYPTSPPSSSQDDGLDDTGSNYNSSL